MKEKENKKMKIYIIRHGETKLNAEGIIQGWLDEPLNDNGIKLAEITGRAMKGIRFDYCFSSPLIRAKQTAEIVLKESGNSTTPIYFDDRLKELHFGELEGKPLSHMGEEGKIVFSDPFSFKGFKGGESINEICARTQQFLKELINKNDDKTYLISTHGCAMRAMTNFLMKNPSDFWQGHVPYNCSFTIIEVEDGRAEITNLDKVFYDKNLIVDHFK